MPKGLYSDQQLLEMAYRDAQYRRQLGKEMEPLSYVVWFAQYYAPPNCSESFYQQVVTWYQSGYNGLTHVPAQFR